ncbi:hypothetical protein EYF80_042606 [Liparis tanakae]|uniref:Uncharacterized protein n=1 Tax=Liparis tanakae TaxID=230148 RepID=A0A4Z2G2A4_9TELE|nr:hypothetical protein EYF80_042606 [Liparis tanakae]
MYGGRAALGLPVEGDRYAGLYLHSVTAIIYDDLQLTFIVMWVYTPLEVKGSPPPPRAPRELWIYSSVPLSKKKKNKKNRKKKEEEENKKNRKKKEEEENKNKNRKKKEEEKNKKKERKR